MPPRSSAPTAAWRWVRPAAPEPWLGHAVALGLAQGPTELLPVSSSAHTNLIPFLLGWPYGELDASVRKSFEVALHAGAGLALAIDMRRELRRSRRAHGRAPGRGGRAVDSATGARRARAGAVHRAPPFGHARDRRRDGRGRCGDGARRRPSGQGRRGARRREDARARDGLALGLAQVAALLPGVSRSGATLTAARARGFARDEAEAAVLARRAAGDPRSERAEGRSARARRASRRASARRSWAERGAPSCRRSSVPRALRRGRRADSLLPYALYRCLLAALVLRRLRQHAQ